MKYRTLLFLALLPFNVLANGEEISEQCLYSLRNLYKFYFHEIAPNPNNESCKNPSDKLDQRALLQMQVVIGELKNHCPTSLIARVNQTMKGDATKTETENG